MAGKKKDELKTPVPVNPISPRAIEGSQGYTAPAKKKKPKSQQFRDFQYVNAWNNVKARFNDEYYLGVSGSNPFYQSLGLKSPLEEQRDRLINKFKPSQAAIDLAEQWANMSREERLNYKLQDPETAQISTYLNANPLWAVSTTSVKRKAAIEASRVSTAGSPFGTGDVEFSRALAINPELAFVTARALGDRKLSKKQLDIVNKTANLLQTASVFTNAFSDQTRLNIIERLPESQREALYNFLKGIADSVKEKQEQSQTEEQNPIISILGTTVGSLLEGMLWLNDNAQHVYRTTIMALQEGGETVPLQAILKYWDATEMGMVDSENLKRIKNEYGAKNVQIVRDVFAAANSEDGFAKVLDKYANDQEALYVIDQIMGTGERTNQISKLIQDYQTISSDDLGNLIANALLPDDWRLEDGASAKRFLWDTVDVGANFTGIFFGDPLIIGGKVAKSYKILKYGLIKENGVANIDRLLELPNVKRFVDNAAERVNQLNKATSNAEAKTIRNSIRRDFGKYLNDDAVDSLSKFMRETERTFDTSSDAFAAWMREADGVERLLMGRPVRAESFLMPRMTRAKQNIIQRRLEKNKTIAFNGSDDDLIKLIVADRIDEDIIRAEFGLGPTDDIAKLADNPEFASRMRSLEARIATESLADVQIRAAIASKYGVEAKRLRRFSLSRKAWVARTDGFLRSLERAPMANKINIVDARDADLFYSWARTTFSRTFSAYLRELWVNGNTGQRRIMLASMFETIADAKGIPAADRGKIVTSALKQNENYGVDLVRIDTLEDGTQIPVRYNPAEYMGRKHALSYSQTADEITLPNFADVQRLSTKVGVLSKILGWSYQNLPTKITNGWSSLNLIGPRYVQRAAIEDIGGFLLSGGKLSEFAAGKLLTQSIREVRGKSTGVTGESLRALSTKVVGGQADSVTAVNAEQQYQKVIDSIFTRKDVQVKPDREYSWDVDDIFDTYPTYQLGAGKETIAFQGYGQNFSDILEPGTKIVQTTPEGILQEALKLNPRDKKIKSLLENFKSGKFGEEENLFLDNMIASISIGRNGEALAKENVDGFAIFLSSLTGNKSAIKIVDEKRLNYYRILKERDELRRAEAIEEYKNLQFDEIADDAQVPVIHSTKYSVVRNEDGSISLFPYAEYSVGTTQPIPRASLHFTLEAPVESHLMGQWGATQTKIVSDLSSMIKNNNLPYNLRSIDTWWMRSPGQPLTISNASVIRPFTDKAVYQSELAKRGLLTEGKLLPVIVVDSKTKDVLHIIKKNYTSADRVQISRAAKEADIVTVTSPDGKTINLLQPESFVGFESVILDSIAMQLAKKQLGIQSPLQKISGWGLTSNQAETRLKSLNAKYGIPGAIHEGTGPAMLEKAIENITNSTKFYGDTIEGIRYAALMGKFSVKPLDNIATRIDSEVSLTDAAATQKQMGKLFLSHLNADEIRTALVAFENGNVKQMQQLLTLAITRNRFGRAAVQFTQLFKKNKIRTADIEDAAKAFVSLGDDAFATLDEVAELSGDLNNFVLNDARYSVRGGRMRRDMRGESYQVSDDWDAALTFEKNPEAYYLYWYKNLHRVLHSDGAIGQHVFRALLSARNVDEARKIALPRIIEEVTDAKFPAYRFSLLQEAGAEKFAQRYFDDASFYFLNVDGVTPNRILLNAITRNNDDGGIIGKMYLMTKSNDVTKEVDANFIKGMFDTNPDARPSHVLGKAVRRTYDEVNSGIFDKTWSVQADALGRVSREPVANARFITEYTALKKALLKNYMDAGLSEAVAKTMIARLANERAAYLAVSYMDNPRIRSIGAYSARNIARYFRASEDFARRVVRLTKYNPDSIQKANVLIDAVQNTGFTWTDDNGQSYFMYPGTGVLHKAVASVFNMLPFPFDMHTTSPYAFGGNLSMLTPSADPDSWLPTFSSPISGFAIKAFTSLGPFEELEGWLLGPRGVQKPGSPAEWSMELFNSVMPSHLRRLMNVLPLDERNGQYAAAVRGAIQIAAYNGELDPSKIKSKSDEIALMDTINQTAMGVLVTRFILGFVTPASPQLVLDEGISNELRSLGIKSLRRGFTQLLEKYEGDTDKALAVWYKLNPKLMPFTVSSAGSVVGGAPVATLKSLEWFTQNKDFAKKYVQASTFLAPAGGQFSYKAYSLIRSLGYIKNKDIDDYFIESITASDYYMYMLSRDDYEKAREQAITSYERGRIDEQWREVKASMFARNPYLEERIVPDDMGKIARERKRILAETRTAVEEIYASNPDMVNANVKKIYKMIKTFDDGMSALEKYSQGNSSYFVYHRKNIKEYLNGLLVDIAGDNVGATNFYERILKNMIEG